MSERELIEQAKRGNGQAFDQLVRPYLDVAFRTAWLIARDADDAEDATQAALIRAYTHLGSFRSGEPFRLWLLQIVANDARNLVRGRVRRRSDPLPDRDLTDGTLDRHDPLQALESRERSAWLVGHINQLDERDRLVIACRFALELTEAEIADVLDCPRGTVKSRLHRALARLRASIETEIQPDEVLP